jgi:hypothetical protein
MRFVVYGFPKLNCKGRPHFVSRAMAIKYVTSQLQLASSLPPFHRSGHGS